MPANYDRIAPIYDSLSRIIFGSAIVEAQVSMLSHIPPRSTILIVGGGTGWILEAIAERHSDGLLIDYVEVSAQMISLSQKRDYKDNHVNFIQQPIEAYIPDKQYDVIITPFLFDNFQEDKIKIIFSKLDTILPQSGIWLYADFTYDKTHSALWQKILLKIMYFFFRITCGIEALALVPMDDFFAPHYEILVQTSRYFGFINAIVYRKQ